MIGEAFSGGSDAVAQSFGGTGDPVAEPFGGAGDPVSESGESVQQGTGDGRGSETAGDSCQQPDAQASCCSRGESGACAAAGLPLVPEPRIFSMNPGFDISARVADLAKSMGASERGRSDAGSWLFNSSCSIVRCGGLSRPKASACALSMASGGGRAQHVLVLGDRVPVRFHALTAALQRRARVRLLAIVLAAGGRIVPGVPVVLPVAGIVPVAVAAALLAATPAQLFLGIVNGHFLALLDQLVKQFPRRAPCFSGYRRNHRNLPLQPAPDAGKFPPLPRPSRVKRKRHCAGPADSSPAAHPG